LEKIEVRVGGEAQGVADPPPPNKREWLVGCDKNFLSGLRSSNHSVIIIIFVDFHTFFGDFHTFLAIFTHFLAIFKHFWRKNAFLENQCKSTFLP
jgi:hypothetical protein